MEVDVVPPAAATHEPKCYVQPTIERPRDMPSDHPEHVHDWSGWPTFPARKNKAKQRAAPPQPSAPPQIKLFNSHEFTPEMELLTSPKGSLLQPAPSFRFTELNDECQYTAWLSFIDADGAKCHAQYQHPDAPRPGELWNGKVVSFDRLKLYRDDGSDHPPVSLKTGKIYRIQVNVGCVDEHGHVQSATVTRQLIGTTFIAVDKKTSAEPGKRSK
ncbi:T-box transcription factor TBX6-like [Rhipicephalus microplus]